MLLFYSCLDKRFCFMKWDFDEVLKKNLNGRKLVVWGTGKTSQMVSGVVSKYSPIEFYISRDANEILHFMNKDVYPYTPNIAKQQYYIVILAHEMHSDIRYNLLASGFEKFIDYYDFCDCFSRSAPLPFDIDFNTCNLGKGSYFGFDLPTICDYIKSIGRFTSINNNVYLIHNHQINMIGTGVFYEWFNEKDTKLAKQNRDAAIANTTGTLKVSIGNDVWIGANVFINASRCSKIGDGAVIGTNSLVLDDVPPYAIAYGSPARVREYRFTSQEIEILQRVKWWNWSDEKIACNAEFLIYPEKFFQRYF